MLNDQMSIISSDDQTKYKRSLLDLKEAWAKFSKLKQNDDLINFQKKCNALSDEMGHFNLLALHKILSQIIHISDELLNGVKDQKQTINEIDWLINQLIRGSKESSDPFLQQNASLESFSVDLTGHIDFDFLAKQKKRPFIAVIDHNRSEGLAIVDTLKDFSFQAHHYPSIEDYRASAVAHVDLVLLDIVLPNISQNEVFEFANELQKIDIDVICCSSKFDFDVRLLAVRAKVSDYVVKPVNTYVLIEKIGRVLGLQNHRKYQVVIVDDQETMGAFYKSVLERVGCEVNYFSDPAELFKSLEDMRPDMFLLDLMMPNVDGLEVAQMIRQEHKFDFAPILFITGDDTLDNRLQAIDVGADDVILKSESVHTITRQVLTRLDRASKVKAFVAKDPLTGVLNHGQIVEESNNFIRSIHRRDSIASLAVIDVDHFKSVNDNYGHLVGDRVLSALGQILRNSVRESDKVGRYGGEEFILIFEDCSVVDAKTKVEQIKEQFENISFTNEDIEFNVTFSAGLVDLKEYYSLQAAINVADKALYQAKNTGRNKVIAFYGKEHSVKKS